MGTGSGSSFAFGTRPEASTFSNCVAAGRTLHAVSPISTESTPSYHFLSLDKSHARFIEIMERFYCPAMNAVEAAQKSGKINEGDSQTTPGFGAGRKQEH